VKREILSENMRFKCKRDDKRKESGKDHIVVNYLITVNDFYYIIIFVVLSIILSRKDC
jgi:hypothetical protein